MAKLMAKSMCLFLFACSLRCVFLLQSLPASVCVCVRRSCPFLRPFPSTGGAVCRPRLARVHVVARWFLPPLQQLLQLIVREEKGIQIMVAPRRYGNPLSRLWQVTLFNFCRFHGCCLLGLSCLFVFVVPLSPRVAFGLLVRNRTNSSDPGTNDTIRFGPTRRNQLREKLPLLLST